MKVLFLDIDGVLNSRQWFASNIRRIYMKLFRIKRTSDISMINPINLYWLKKIVKRYPDIKIVLSSSWRYFWNFDGKPKASRFDIDKFFRRNNINIYSRTDVKIPLEFTSKQNVDWNICSRLLNNNFGLVESKEKFLEYARGSQILYYLYEYPCDNYVILEDDVSDVNCFTELQPHVVQTYFYGKKSGLRKEHYKQVYKILGE